MIRSDDKLNSRYNGGVDEKFAGLLNQALVGENMEIQKIRIFFVLSDKYEV